MTNKINSSISFILCFILLCRAEIFAQPVIAPSLSDNTIISNCGEGFGTAMINYGQNAVNLPTNVIFGAAWQSSCPTSLITVTDVGTGNVATCMPAGLPPHTNWNYSCIPDVVIGNSTPSRPNNFVMAVAYSSVIAGFSGTYIIVDFYDIFGAGVPGPGSLSVVFNREVIVSAMPQTLYGEDVHIDIIADHSSSPGAFPICRNFGLTFEDPGGGGNIYIAEGDVSLYTVGPACTISGIAGSQPDIAAIQRNVAPFGPPVIDDYALLTWTSVTGDVMYGEYDLTAMTCTPVPGTVQTVEALLGSPYLAFTNPRIDGDDDYTTNAPGGGHVVYELAYQANTSYCPAGPDYDAATIHTYNNLTGPYDPTTGLPGSLLGIGSFNPITVRAGGNNYDVLHWVGENLVTPSICYSQQNGAIVMEPISDITGTMAGYPYYEVSTGASPGVVGPNIDNNFIYTWHGGEWSISASSTCNTASSNTSLTLYAWVQLGIGGVPLLGAKYKLSPAVPYGFKQDDDITGTIGVSQTLSLSPNPNSGAFSITGTVPTDKASDQATVEITDVLGNTVFADKAPVTNSAINMHVNLESNLANGMYVAHVRCASSNQVFKFTLDR